MFTGIGGAGKTTLATRVLLQQSLLPPILSQWTYEHVLLWSKQRMMSQDLQLWLQQHLQQNKNSEVNVTNMKIDGKMLQSMNQLQQYMLSDNSNDNQQQQESKESTKWNMTQRQQMWEEMKVELQHLYEMMDEVKPNDLGVYVSTVGIDSSHRVLQLTEDGKVCVIYLFIFSIFSQ